tara:strand:+ start:25 stop:549 length:525 start_codon:yes stop_codon:yes gene_type:complete
MIETINNFLPSKVENLLEDIFLGKSNYKMPLYFTPNITYGSGEEFNPSFSSDFYPNLLPPSNLLLNVLYFFAYFKNLYVTDIIRAKAITQIVSPRPGLNHPHVDLHAPHLVLLYYINDAVGDTILFNDKDEEIQRVTPQKGTAIFFDGSIRHCSSRPSKFSRSILNFNFLAEKI